MSTRPSTPAADEILNLYFPALDHGFVSLVDYMGTDECIERAARVSYGLGTRATSQTRGLIRYLRRHKHTTPSEMLELKFHCCMPIFVARQWIRHRTASVNEYSGRYSLMPMLFYTPEQANLQTQSTTNRQGQSGNTLPDDLYQEAVTEWRSARKEAQDQYEWLTGNDVARELARIDLPLSTYTQWYWKIDLHNLLHFLTLRVDTHAQYEIRVYGEIIAGMLARIAPLSYEAWIDYDVCGGRFSRQELEVLRGLLRVVDGSSVESRVSGDSDPLVVNESDLAGHDLTGREAKEFFAKLQDKARPDFKLDLAQAKEGAHFEERFKAAVPSDTKSGERSPRTKRLSGEQVALIAMMVKSLREGQVSIAKSEETAAILESLLK